MALQAGFGRTLINPPSHIPAGTWMAQKHVRASGLDMDLRATALVLSDGPLSVAIIDLDLCFLSDTQAAALRQAVHESTGIAPDRVLPFCSHTHAGPVILETYRGEGEDQVNNYVRLLPDLAAGAAVQAVQSQQPVRVEAGCGHSDIGVNRDLLLPDGRMITGCNPDGFRDREVGVIRFDSLDGKPVGSIVNYACHPTVLGPGNTLVSPDYPGSTRQIVEQLTGAPCLFLQGAAGNMGPVETFVDDAAVARRLGTRLGLEAARVFLTLDTRPVERRLKDVTASGAQLARYEDVPIDAPPPRLKLASAYVDLPVRSPLADVYESAPEQLTAWNARLSELQGGNGAAADIAVALQQVTRLALRADRMERYRSKQSLGVETHAVSMGAAALVAVAGEPYCEIGVAVKKKSPFPNKTLVAGYLGGDMMYIPTADIFACDPPPMEVDNSPYTPEAEKIVTGHLIRLLESL